MLLAARSLASFRLAPRVVASSVPSSIRALHATSLREAVTKMAMPAMSPTMTEGGLAEWKVKEGQSFAQGDVLLDIETDKATMDVEAPEDGVLAKILVGNGSKDVPVGKTIALLAEEGDDLSNIEIPTEEEKAPAASSASAPAPEAPKAQEPFQADSSPAVPAASSNNNEGALHPPSGGPYLPSVARLLTEKKISDPSQIKGTGLHGRLTKGDVLAFLGEASSPFGTYKPAQGGVASIYGSGASPAAASDKSTASAKGDTKPKAAEPVRLSFLITLPSATKKSDQSNCV